MAAAAASCESVQTILRKRGERSTQVTMPPSGGGGQCSGARGLVPRPLVAEAAGDQLRRGLAIARVNRRSRAEAESSAVRELVAARGALPLHNMAMRWHYRDPLLVWLFVPAYAAHLLEEWFGGFPEWLSLVTGAPLPRDVFLIINAVAMIAIVWAIHAALRRESLGWLAIAIAAVLFVNGLVHLLGSILTGTYSPGLFTGVLLYVPLGQLALMRAWTQAPKGFFQRGVLTAIGAHASVSSLVFAISRAQ
jgi:hypothetical protein